MKRKSELLAVASATELLKADYEANVDIPTTANGVSLVEELPRFFHSHSDHERV